MTLLLQELRHLDAARRRHELSETEYAARRAELMAQAEDAAEAGPPEPVPARPAPLSLWSILGLLACAVTTLTTLGALAVGDLTLALTLSITLLAALTIGAFQSLGD